MAGTENLVSALNTTSRHPGSHGTAERPSEDSLNGRGIVMREAPGTLGTVHGCLGTFQRRRRKASRSYKFLQMLKYCRYGVSIQALGHHSGTSCRVLWQFCPPRPFLTPPCLPHRLRPRFAAGLQETQRHCPQMPDQVTDRTPLNDVQYLATKATARPPPASRSFSLPAKPSSRESWFQAIVASASITSP